MIHFFNNLDSALTFLLKPTHLKTLQSPCINNILQLIPLPFRSVTTKIPFAPARASRCWEETTNSLNVRNLERKKNWRPGQTPCTFISTELSPSLASELSDCRYECLLFPIGLLSAIAMAMSLGKRSRSTKAWTTVETSKAVTVRVEMEERVMDKPCVNGFWTSLEYLMDAMETPVMGKVYAHHANENLWHEQASEGSGQIM